MMKVIAQWIVLVAFSGAAFAQTGSAASAAGSAAAGSAAPVDAAKAPVPAPPVSDARKACTDAMNADPKFAAAIVSAVDVAAAARRDADTIKAHTDADQRIQRNERHVIFSYAAMWVLAAGFVIFLWRRQQGLKEELANLRRDLEAAADDASSAKARS